MEDRLNITLCGIGGMKLSISPCRSHTLREIITDSGMLPSKTFFNPLCIFRGNQVHVDMSLASLNVENGETITVVFPKFDQKKKRIERAQLVEKLESDIYHEALRVTDLQFSMAENVKSASLMYQSMYNEMMENSQEPDVFYPTFIPQEEQKQPSEAPLPICWPAQDTEFFPFLQNRRHRRRKAK